MKSYKLFAAYGIELEYMIVDRNTLAICPISDEVLKAAAGHLTSDYEDQDITWSNELVLHVIELKTTAPERSLKDLESSFNRSLKKLQDLLNCLNRLESKNVRLMPTAMHPFMRPDEMKLWPHDNNEIYQAYDRIFGCHGHGWCNLQSMHINLPFSNDDEFERLHTAIRLLLPILPALSASSPIVEGQQTGIKDNRLKFYQHNQSRIPSIAGQVIPELVDSIGDYENKILKKIYHDIAPHDPDELLRDDWLNSRGAIARFGRRTIEIRVLDIQETPSVDLAIAEFICATLQRLTNGEIISHTNQRTPSTESLKVIFDQVIISAEAAPISTDYAALWNTQAKTASELWNFIYEKIKPDLSPAHARNIEFLLKHGSLASRMSRALPTNPTQADITTLYRRLCDCLDNDQMFTAPGITK